MLAIYIKYFTIIFCSLYTYKKLLNLCISVINKLITLAFISVLGLLIYYLRVNFMPLIIPVMIVLSLIIMKLTTRVKLELSITTTILSFGICYATSTIAAILSVAIFKLLGVEDNSMFYLSITAALIQLFLIIMPFRSTRLKNGMPFLINKGASNAGVLISVILLSCTIILSNLDDVNFLYVMSIVFILLSAVLILFWWRGRITNLYLERLKTEEIRRLEETIREKDERISQLERHNEALAKIIHKDNKLIPAMKLAIEECLQYSGDEDELREKGQLLLEQLRVMSGERSGILTAYQAGSKELPVTGIAAVDALMSYMFNKARENGIDMELTLSGSVKYMTENIVSVADLATLLADLTENAIIAAQYSDRKKILVLIGITERFYMVNILDSGIPFEADTLANMGLRKSTTHADNGGSGIGLMSTFEILNRYKASLTIEEFSTNDGIFTKRISILFDEKNQFLIQTDREDEIKELVQRDNLLIEKSCRVAK